MRVDNHVQSILVDSRLYEIADVYPIVRALGYNCFYIDLRGNHYRVRQFNPSLRKNPKYKTIKSDKLPGVEYVIQY